jgi:dTMP kinase
MFAVENLLPDLTILLDLDAASSMASRAKTGTETDRLEREKVEFFEAVRAGYLKLAAAEPERFIVIPATQTIEQIQTQIRARLTRLLG